MARAPVARHESQGRQLARRRSGFTLLEVLLAFAIGVLLMAALYAAVDVQLRHAQAGREVATEGRVVRSLLERIAGDINAHLAPSLPPTTGGSGNSGSAAAGSAGAATGPSASPSTNSAGGTTSATTSTTTASAGDTVVFNLGVQGTASRLTLFDSKVPREVLKPAAVLASQPTQPVSDLRRISYWLAGAGDQPLGLARQEIKLATSSDQLSSIPPDIADEAAHVFAEEVKSLTFSYFDGSTWQDTWDGTTAGPDGVTPIGPPLAIAIVVGVAPSGADRGQGRSNLKTYRHVVLIPTANGAMQATATQIGQ